MPHREPLWQARRVLASSSLAGSSHSGALTQNRFSRCLFHVRVCWGGYGPEILLMLYRANKLLPLSGMTASILCD